MKDTKSNFHTSVGDVQFRWRGKWQCLIIFTTAIALLASGLLIGCTSSAPTSQTAPNTQAQASVVETTADTSGIEASEVAPRLGVLVDSSMKVVDIMSQSPAERGGVQVGDILQSFDGLSYAKEGEKIIDNLNREAPSDRKVHQLILLRGDQELQLEFDLTIPDDFVPPKEPPTPVPADSGLSLY